MGITFQAPCVQLTKLKNLWLQLSNVSCNIKCKHCFLDCHHDIKKKNFLQIDKIQEALSSSLPDLERIFLTGGEPFLHKEIFEIIKISLEKANVTIYSNGTLISEKKVKIIKSMENNTNHHVSFILSLDHFTEGRNDEYRARGVFKKVLNAIKLLRNYDFEVNITCVNLKNEPENLLQKGFEELFVQNRLDLRVNNLRIIPLLKMGSYAKYYSISSTKNHVTFDDFEKFDIEKLDCQNARVLTIDGIYSCPALVNDPRGLSGRNIQDFSHKVYLETETCFECLSRNQKLFG